MIRSGETRQPLHVRILSGKIDRSAGSGVYHVDLGTRLAARGYRVSMAALPSEKAVTPEFETLTLSNARHKDWPGVWRISAFADYHQYSRDLRRAGLSQPDVTIAGEHLLLEAHARLFPTVPWIYIPHSLLLHHELDGAGMKGLQRWSMQVVYGRLQRWALRHAAVTLRFTQYGCRALEHHYGAKLRTRFVVNPIGIDMPAPTTRESPPRLLWVGALNRRKRPEVALRALAAVLDHPWQCDIVGGAPDDLQDMRALAECLGLSHRVTFHGHQADPSPWYRGAHLLLLPSMSESLGLVVLEAMSYGLPVLAMKADDKAFFNPYDEFVRNGIDGFLAPTDDCFTETLRDLVAAPERLAIAGARARVVVSQRFTWSLHLDRYDDLFERLVRPGGCR